jgi:hypothetical protein
MLVKYGENYDGTCGYYGPDKERDFATCGPAPRRFARDWLPCQEGVFFCLIERRFGVLSLEERIIVAGHVGGVRPPRLVWFADLGAVFARSRKRKHVRVDEVEKYGWRCRSDMMEDLEV